jgi:hypothetical protein
MPLTRLGIYTKIAGIGLYYSYHIDNIIITSSFCSIPRIEV